MADYKITKVSEQAPREWGEGEKKIYYIKVTLQGHERPVAIGKKSPDALKVGDIVSGTIEPTEYEADKFKPEKKPFIPGAKSYGKSPEEQANIMKQTALKAAVEHLGSSIDNLPNSATVIEVAQEFYDWLKGDK